MTAAFPLEIVAPDKRAHSEEMFDLIAKVFSGLGYFTGRDWCRDSYVNQSGYDWRVSRIGLHQRRIVTHFGVWEYAMRIGTATVRTGGIGAVATHGDFRKRGLMDGTARASVEAMRAAGYDMSLLFGINDFYHRFGYTRAWSDSLYTVKVKDLPAAKPDLPPVKFTPHIRKDIGELYNRYYAATTGTAVRPTYRKFGYPHNSALQGYLWREGGVPAGYVLLTPRGNRLDCSEYAGDAEQALRVLGMLGRKWHCDEVRFETLPYTSPLARQLRRGTCRVETQYVRCGGAMVCLLNLASTLGKLTGELSRRLSASPFAAWRGNLLIANQREQAMLAIDQGGVSLAPPVETPHVLRGGDALAQLLLGTDDPAEIRDAYGMDVQGDADALIQVLFPDQHPQLHLFDRY